MVNVNDLNELMIIDAFSANNYALFVEYCDRNNIKTVAELEGFDFASLVSNKVLTNTVIKNVMHRYEKILEKAAKTEKSTKAVPSLDYNVDTLRCLKVNPDIADVAIDIMVNFGFRSTTIDNFKTAGFEKLGDLARFTMADQKKLLNSKTLDSFDEFKELLQCDLYAFFEKILEMKSKEDSYTMMLLRAQGHTLQEVGDIQNLTRERIRQLTEKLAKKLYPIADVLGARFTKDKDYITVQDLIDIYDNDDYDQILVMLFKSYTEYWEYIDFAGVFVPAKKYGATTRAILVGMIEDFVGDIMDLSEKGDEFCNYMAECGYPYIDTNAIKNLAPEINCRVYKDFVARRKQGYSGLCTYIIDSDFPEGIKLYDSGAEDLDRLRQLALERFGDLGLPEDNRSLSVQIDRKCYLCGRGRVTTANHFKCEFSLMESIKKFIDEVPATEIPYVEVFEHFKDEIEKHSNISSRYMLQGALQIYYGNEYDFNRDQIIKNNGLGSSYGLKERLEDYIISANRPVPKKELQDHFKGVSPIMFMNAVADSTDIIQWRYNYYHSLKLLKTTSGVNVKKVLDKYISKQLKENQGFTSENLLYKEAKQELAKFIEDNAITESINLYYIAQALFKDKYDFRHPHIAEKGKVEDLSVCSIVKNYLGEGATFSVDDYEEIARRLCWPDSTYYMNIRHLNADYMRIDQKLYVPADMFKIAPDSLKIIMNVVQEEMPDGYLVIKTFDKWDQLPDIGFTWNQFLLRTVIDNYFKDYNVVDTALADRRYEKGIVAAKKLNISCYADLVAYVLKLKNWKEINESQMLSVLTKLDLAQKVVPIELYSAEKIVYVKQKDICKFVVKAD